VLIESGGTVEGRCGFVLLFCCMVVWLFCCMVVVCFLFGVFLWRFLVVRVVFDGFQDFSRFLAITQNFFQFSSWRILGCFLFKGFFIDFLVKELRFGGFQDFSRLHCFSCFTIAYFELFYQYWI
jgi:hypothetical protein